MKILHALIFVLAFSSQGCVKHKTVAQTHTKIQKMERLRPKDGHERVAYRDDNGLWWYYVMATNTQPTYVGGATVGGPRATSLPSGGIWSQSKVGPGPGEEEEEEDVSVEEDALSEPVSESPSESSAEGASAPSGDPVGIPALSEPSAPAESSGGDSSGGGGDSGGGGSCGGSSCGGGGD